MKETDLHEAGKVNQEVDSRDKVMQFVTDKEETVDSQARMMTGEE